MKNAQKLRFLLFLLSLFIVNFTLLLAQKQGQARIDSLLKELPKAIEDTNKVNLLADLSFDFHLINPDEGIKYGEQGVQLAEKLNWKKGLARSLNNLGNCYRGKSNNQKALDYYLKSLKLNEEIADKKQIASNLSNIGNIFKDQSHYSKALEYYFKALKINEEIDNKKQIATNLGNIGNVYNELSDYSKALEYYFKALKIHEELGNKSGIARNLGNIGNVYSEQSDYSKALEYYFKTLKIYEELGDKNGIAENLINIGNIFNQQSDFPKSLEYYFKSLKIEKELNDRSGIAMNFVNIGIAYGHQSDYSMALEYYYKALKINEELGIKSGIAFNFEQIGKVFMKQSDFKKALEYYFKALNIYEELGEKRGIAFNLNNIGAVYGSQHDLTKALEYFLKALKMAEEIGDKMNQLSIFQRIGNIYIEKSDYTKAFEYYKKALKVSNEIGDRHFASDLFGKLGELYYYMATDTAISNKQNTKLYFRKAVENLEACVKIHKEIGMKHREMHFLKYLVDSYEGIGNFKKAYENIKRYNILKDSVFNFEKSKEIANLEANYKVEKKEKENKILNLEIDKQTSLRNYLIIISILILLLAIVTYNRYLHKKKTGKILEEKNSLLKQANDEIERTYKEKIQLQHETHEKESQIMNLKNELLEKELEQKQKELATLAINLVDKNEYLVKLKEQAELIGQAKPDEVYPFVRSIIRSINLNVKSEGSWEIFETQFKAIHRGFMEFIASKYFDLTVMEMKVCALLKINLSSKEIASLLNLSIRTVEVHRLNIRKKLGLDKDVNLNQFIATLQYIS